MPESSKPLCCQRCGPIGSTSIDCRHWRTDRRTTRMATSWAPTGTTPPIRCTGYSVPTRGSSTRQRPRPCWTRSSPGPFARCNTPVPPADPADTHQHLPSSGPSKGTVMVKTESGTVEPTIAIVGSGPSGCYTAQFLRKRWPAAEIVIIDRLDHPYGLVNYGVALDHPGTKAVARQFDRLFQRDGVTFAGNIEIGTDITLDELRGAF